MEDRYIGDVLIDAMAELVAACLQAAQQTQDTQALHYAQAVKELAQATQAIGLKSSAAPPSLELEENG
jgi:hypothetical protein